MTKIKLERIELPAGLLICAPEPVPPIVVSQRDVATYLLDLAAAGEDCRSKLGEVRKLAAQK